MMLKPPSYLPAVLAVALVGCTGPAGPCPAAETPPMAGNSDECGSALHQRYIGAPLTDAIRSAIASAAGNRPVRFIAPGDAVTMDFNPSRLNVELTSDRRIRRLRCG